MYEHRNRVNRGFATRYNLTRLVYCEETGDVDQAIRWEKEIKGWTRAKKIELIESVNPGWHDLAEGWFAPPRPQILRASE